LTCRPAQLARRPLPNQLVITLTQPADTDRDLLAVGTGVSIVRDPDGHMVALFVTDLGMVIDAANQAEIPVVLTVDEEADMGYLYLGTPGSGKVSRTVTLHDGSIVIDLDQDDRLIGIEFFGAGSWFCPAVIAATATPGVQD
jgi:uncharacterized protein YuzE